MVPMSAPLTASRALLLQAAGCRAVLVQGAAAGRALLLGPAASGRVTLVAVGGAAAASPRLPRCTAGGGNHDHLPGHNDEDNKAKMFGEMLQEVTLGVLVQGEEELLDGLAAMAKEADALLATMIQESPAPLPDHIQQELILVSASFREVEGHCDLGYVTDASVVAATRGVMRMSELFLESGAAEVDLGGKIVCIGGPGASREEKTAYVRKLANVFYILVRHVKNVYLRRAGGGNHRSDHVDDHAAKAFGEILQALSLGVVVQGDEKLLDRLATMAKEAGDLLAIMIEEKEASSPLPDNVRQELILVSASFTEVEGNCKLGYVTAAGVVAATRGVKRMSELLLGNGAGAGASEVRLRAKKMFYIGGEGARQEQKTAYVEKLVTAFSVLVRDVKNVYLRRRARD